MTRYYYKDKLSAAWMAKNFGVFIKMDKFNSTQSTDDIMQSDLEKYYIDKDSLSIFKPQEGDIVESDGVNYGIVLDVTDDEVGIQYSTDEKGCCIVGMDYVDEVVIIQRDFQSFMRPEKED